MRILPFTLLLMAGVAGASEFPPSVHSIADCDNRWFLAEGQDPSVRFLGFAYVDPTAGITIEHNGEVVLGAEGALVRKPNALDKKARVIARVGSNVRIACLSDDQATHLGLPLIPEWLRFYKDDRAPGPHNVAWASFYNHIGACEKALEFIQVARDDGYTSVELSYEHGFALNAMSRFRDARQVLDAAVKDNPDNVQLTGELAYSYLHLREFNRAIELYKTAIAKDQTADSARRAEFAQNISIGFSALGDEKSAAEWRKKSETWKNAR
jgi:tetratricopeptide (TPR) repeat protein